MEKLILVGSAYFFKDFEDYLRIHEDYVKIVDNPIGFNYVKETYSKSHLFEWKRMTPREYIDYALNNGTPMQLGKFLVKEFVDEIGFTIEYLKELKPLVENLDYKHKYLKAIYDSYIENNSFTLTTKQLNKAYEEYKSAR